MTLEERISALEISMNGARKAFSDLRNDILEIKNVQQSLRTLFVDLRGESAVDLHESMNPKKYEDNPNVGTDNRYKIEGGSFTGTLDIDTGVFTGRSRRNVETPGDERDAHDKADGRAD